MTDTTSTHSASANSSPQPGGAHPVADTISFPRKVWRLLVAIKDGLVLAFMLMLFVLIIAALSRKPDAVGDIKEGALLIDLDGIVTEQPSDFDSLTSLPSLYGQQVPQHRLRDIVHAIRTAATDDRVKAIVLDLDRFVGGGQVALSDIGNALDAFRAQKKPVLAFATSYGDDAYQLAAHASEVWSDPSGGVLIAGPGGSRLYYKELLDKLDIDVHVYRVGTYKSAIEPYTRSEQSSEAEEAASAFYGVLWEEWQTDVQKARPKAKLNSFISDPIAAMNSADKNLAKAALEAGLVDKLGGRLAFGLRMGKIVGAKDEDRPWRYKYISLKNWVADNPVPDSGSAIAVIPVVGEIVDGEAPNGTAGGDTIAKHIMDAISDDDVKALVLRVDSPGGSVLASEHIRQALLHAKTKELPIVVSMANVAASGGYWIATPADRIFAEPDTITGSIGVFGIIPSFERTLAEIGINADGIATTPMTGQPDIFDGVSKEFDQMTQNMVEDIYGRFLALVAENRKMSVEKIAEIAEGRVWAGGTAHQLGLVDQLGGLDDALEAAAKLAKIDGETYPLYFETQPDPWSQFIASVLNEKKLSNQQPQNGWFGQKTSVQNRLKQRFLQDMQLLAATPSVLAVCLECRTAVPLIPRPHSDAATAKIAKEWLELASWFPR